MTLGEFRPSVAIGIERFGNDSQRAIGFYTVIERRCLVIAGIAEGVEAFPIAECRCEPKRCLDLLLSHRLDGERQAVRHRADRIIVQTVGDR